MRFSAANAKKCDIALTALKSCPCIPLSKSDSGIPLSTSDSGIPLSKRDSSSPTSQLIKRYSGSPLSYSVIPLSKCDM